MPIIKSARKRVKVAQKATVRNAKTKRSLRTALKSFQEAVTTGKKVGEAHREAQSALDTAGKKNILHKNKVARKKQQLSKQAKAAGSKPTAKKTTRKAVTKKAAPAKKPATKAKATTKKPAAAKKAPAKKTTKK